MNVFLRILRIPELRNGLLFILLVVTIFRFAAHIPVPGIDASSLSSLLAGNQFLGLLNVFSGGTLQNFSVVALGVAPYITASIIFQLLGMIFPSMEELQKEEQGRQRINRWTRFATVPLSLLQGYALVTLINKTAGLTIGGFELIIALVSMTAGTIFLMWLAELISERKMGNGMSIMIFAGIIASFPSFLAQSLATYTRAELVDVIVFIALTLFTIITVVFVSEGQRNLPVQYARGGTGGGSKVMSSLPLRVNMGGMIPILFALSLITLPPLVGQFFVDARTQVIRDIATWVVTVFSAGWFYAIAEFGLVVMFTFFYASIVFRPDQVAENLQKQGGFIPGVRPGVQTANYIQWVVNRVLLAGAVFLATIAVLPVVMQEITGNPNMLVGGSSVIIVVSVIIDMVKQTEAQLSMRSYDV